MMTVQIMLVAIWSNGFLVFTNETRCHELSGKHVAWFFKMMKMVLLKGAGWKEIQHMILILTGMGVLFYGVVMNRSKKTLS